ncbi:hypothetical protein DRO54_01705 [Candidatus Bathyarchaeota archaeon]|nr:MAG: hypothetical protein DRO54_01705 [Candidatus Bathyarchaeota archaeon]
MEEKKKEFPIPRLYLILIMLAAAIIVCAMGTFLPVDQETLANVSQQIEETRNLVKSLDYLSASLYIFSHNFVLCLIMFIPLFGVGFGMYVMLSTGYAIEIDALAHQVPPPLAFISYFLLPHFWMEFISYALATSQSILITWALYKRESGDSLTETLKTVGITAALLFAAALIETALIFAFS